MIERLANAPNGGNKQQVEYTLIDDMEQMDFFRRTVRREMERISGEGIYPEGFGKEAYEDMKRWEETVRPDMFFCGAPHVLIPHAPAGVGEAERDTVIAGTYFGLLCASRGLGSVIMTFPLSVLELKTVSLYIKFNKLENCFVIVILFHEQKFPLTYCFK